MTDTATAHFIQGTAGVAVGVLLAMSLWLGTERIVEVMIENARTEAQTAAATYLAAVGSDAVRPQTIPAGSRKIITDRLPQEEPPRLTAWRAIPFASEYMTDRVMPAPRFYIGSARYWPLPGQEIETQRFATDE